MKKKGDKMEQGLTKKYGLITAIAMVVGIVIGSGVFFKTEKILVATGGNLPFGFLSRRTFLLQEIFQGLICSKSLKISLFILSSIVSLLVLLK